MFRNIMKLLLFLSTVLLPNVISQMKIVQLHPQNTKTLELTEKHDKHVLQVTASCY